MKRLLTLLTVHSAITLSTGTLLVSAVAAQSSQSNSSPMPAHPSATSIVKGSVSFGQQKAEMTHLYFRRKMTDNGPVVAVMFSNQPLSERALNDHQTLVQLARKGVFLGLSAEIDQTGEMRESELFHREGPFTAPWKFEPAKPSSPMAGRIGTDEEGEFFGERYAVGVSYQIGEVVDDSWRGSALLEPRPTGLPLGRAHGWMERMGRKTEFAHAVAVVETDLFGGEGERSLLFSTHPIADKMLAQPQGPEQQLQKGVTTIRIRIDSKGEVSSVTAPADDGQMMMFSSSQWTLELTRTPGTELDGTLQSEESGLGSEYPRLQLRFHVATKPSGPPAPITAETGSPLPKDGGEPGKAYRSFLKAVKNAKSIEELLPLRVGGMSDELAAVPVEARADFLKFIKGEASKPLKIVGGFGNESQATLWLEGREKDEFTRGRVNVHRQDGVWKLGAESYRITANP